MHSKFGWGYSIFHYLSASIGCHPDYASYLLDKKHLLVEDIKEILEKIPKEYSYEFNKKIIEDLYFSSNTHHAKTREPFLCIHQRVVLIGSGKNVQAKKQLLRQEDAVLIALNHLPQDLKVDYVFFNSIKRFKSLSEKELLGVNKIFSSNLREKATRDDYLLDYQEMITIDEKTRSDNSAIMFVNYLQKRGFKSVELAGIDGFDVNSQENYSYQEFDCVVDKKALSGINSDIKKCLDILSKKIKIIFLTESIFETRCKSKDVQ